MADTAPPPPPPQATDAKSFYGYLYQENKTPTPVFHALLRSLAQYIIDNIGDTDEKTLNPKKLAAFYSAAGADYDALFLGDPGSLSYIWQVTGCRHVLHQPAHNDYVAPTIPALTAKGFSRWQSVETLLCPDVHVPLLQFVVRNWNLKNLETGEPFPPDLPKEALPSKPDAEIEAWHNNCANKLRREAEIPTVEEERPPAKPRFDEDIRYHDHPHAASPSVSPPSSPPSHPPRPTPPPSRSRTDGDDYSRTSFARYVSATAGFAATVGAASLAYRHRRPPADTRAEDIHHRSFSDHPQPEGSEPKVKIFPPTSKSAGHFEPGNAKIPLRRNSKPRPLSSSGSSDDDMPRLRTKKVPPLRQHHSDEFPPVSGHRTYRQSPPSVPIAPSAMPIPMPGRRESSSSGADQRRRDDRRPPVVVRHPSPRRSPGRPRRKSLGIPTSLRENLSSLLSGSGTNLERSRSQGRAANVTGPRYTKETVQSSGSRLGRSLSFDSDDDHEIIHLETERARERREVNRDYDRGRHRDDYRSPERDRPNYRERERDREHDRELERYKHDRDRGKEKDGSSRDRTIRSKDRGREDDYREHGRRYREDYERHRERDRERDRDRDRDRDSGRDRYSVRPEPRRPSSHGDMEKLHTRSNVPDMDSRERSKDRDRERERDRDRDRDRDRRKRDVVNSNSSLNSANSNGNSHVSHASHTSHASNNTAK